MAGQPAAVQPPLPLRQALPALSPVPALRGPLPSLLAHLLLLHQLPLPPLLAVRMPPPAPLC